MPATGTYTLIVWDYYNANTGGYNANLICLNCPNSSGLSLTTSDSPDPVLAGSSLTYGLSVHNDGSLAATGVTVTDTLPSGVAFVSAVTDQGSCTQASGTVVCGLGVLASGADAAVTIVVTASTAGQITNMAVVQANEVDPDHSNNLSTAVTTVVTEDEDYYLYLPQVSRD
jgi:uncharacterized repeat protein (TIGR01451 family)